MSNVAEISRGLTPAVAEGGTGGWGAYFTEGAKKVAELAKTVLSVLGSCLAFLKENVYVPLKDTVMFALKNPQGLKVAGLCVVVGVVATLVAHHIFCGEAKAAEPKTPPTTAAQDPDAKAAETSPATDAAAGAAAAKV